MSSLGARWSVASAEARLALVEAVCLGASFGEAAASAQVAFNTALAWWKRHAQGMSVIRGGGVLVQPQDVSVGQALTLAERVEIHGGLREGLSHREIAKRLGRPQSTVSRELTRHRDTEGYYLPVLADARARQHRRRPKAFKLVMNPDLARHVESAIENGWSPKLIADMLAKEHPGDQTWRVSHETIYQALYVQGRGVLRQDLARQLSTKRVARRPRSAAPRGAAAIYKDAFTISDRPAEVADRAVPGHWEGDLILGATGSGSAIGTLVERKSRFTILLHLPGRHTADEVANVMVKEMRKLPQHLRRSITWDRGTELAEYAQIQLDLDARVYFCDPYSPWQRGTNENTNRLLRHWFHKGSDLSVHSAEDLARVAATLNARPRPTLDYRTPAQVMNSFLMNQ